MDADRIIGLCSTDLMFWSVLQLEVYEDESVIEGMYISIFYLIFPVLLWCILLLLNCMFEWVSGVGGKRC